MRGCNPAARIQHAQIHTPRDTPVYGVVIIICGLVPDPAPQLAGGQSGPHAVCQRGHATPVAPSAAAPATREQLVGAGVGDGRGGTHEAVQEVADSGGEGCRLHVLGKKQYSRY